MKRFKDILCVAVPGEACKPALERAVALAENNQASLSVMVVIKSDSVGFDAAAYSPGNLQAAMIRTQEQLLEPLVESYRKRVDVQIKVLTGTPFLEIIREVLRHSRDLVIKISETADWLNRPFGSVDMHLLRKCPCPVWLIKPEAQKSYRRILAAVDVDDNCPPAEQEKRQSLNRQILQMAGSLALSEFAELHIVHAWEAVGESALRGPFVDVSVEEIKAYVEQVRRQHQQALDALIGEVTHQVGQDALDYLKPQTHLVKGWAHKEVPAVAKQIKADLIVMGTVARTGIPGFIMGNTAETILNQIDCSVLAIKPPGFITPVTLED